MHQGPHKDDERAAKLRTRGIDVAIEDIQDFQATRAALIGVHSAYFIYPLEVHILKTAFAQAAKEAGVKTVVDISLRIAHIDSASHVNACQNLLKFGGVRSVKQFSHGCVPGRSRWNFYWEKAVRWAPEGARRASAGAHRNAVDSRM